MYSKVTGIIITLAIVISAWYIYAIYPFTMNFIFASSVSVIVIGYAVHNKNNEIQEVEKGIDIARIVLTGVGFLAFIVFFVLSGKLGGSSAGDSYASWGYENYEAGQYYLVSHGRFTLVTYRTWIRMKVFEQIAITLFLVAAMWNFLYIARTKGIKFLVTGKDDEIGFTFKNSTTTEKIGFVFIFVFVFSIAISIMFTLF